MSFNMDRPYTEEEAAIMRARYQEYLDNPHKRHIPEANFTKGCWTAERDEFHFGTLSTVTGGPYTKEWPNKTLHIEVGGSAPPEEQEANTRLVAAAPSQFYALVACVKLLHELKYDGIVLEQAYQALLLSGAPVDRIRTD